MPDIDISIIIVNYKSSGHLKKCLPSIYASKLDASYEVIVVDNDSSDPGWTKIKSDYPQATFLELDENRGFAAGNNAGIKLAIGNVIALINPDVEVAPDAIQILYDKLSSRKNVGIVGPKIYYADKSLPVLPRMIPNLRFLLYSQVFLGKLFPRNAEFNLYNDANLFDFDKEQYVDQICGACLMIKKETVEKIGLLDENFFLYYEETDWCLRSKQAGYKTLYVPRATIFHYEGGSSEARKRRSTEYFYQSELYFFRKHYGKKSTVCLYLINISGFIFRLIISAVYLAKEKNTNKVKKNFWGLIFHLNPANFIKAIR